MATKEVKLYRCAYLGGDFKPEHPCHNCKKINCPWQQGFLPTEDDVYVRRIVVDDMGDVVSDEITAPKAK